MSAPRIIKMTAPKGSISVNLFSPSANVEACVIIRRPFCVRSQMKKINAMRKYVAAFGSDLEIVSHKN